MTQLPFSFSDEHYMRIALNYARRHSGFTAENPSVGCVIVKDDQIIAAAVTAVNGRPHAETLALAQAGRNAKDATVYVTLEPCAHEGQAGSCAKALITAGVKQVIVALKDPFSPVNGKGLSLLEKAGIKVKLGVLEQEAKRVHHAFIQRVKQGLPQLSVKVATSLDGKMALKNGDSQWITNEWSRRYGHLLRARHQAILTGIGTVLADDPTLNCRIHGLEMHSPTRIVVDTHLKISLSAKLVQTAQTFPLWIVTSSADILKQQKLQEMGAKIIHCEVKRNGHINLTYMLRILAVEGVNSVLVEAGPALTTSILHEQHADELFWFRAAKILGDDAKAAIAELDLTMLANAPNYKLSDFQRFGDDIMCKYRL